MDEIKFQKMISSWLDEAISLEEQSELEQLLRADAHARRIYLQHVSAHAELCSLESAKNYFESLSGLDAQQEVEVVVAPVRKDQTPIALIWWPFAIAVGFMLALGLWQTTAHRNEPQVPSVVESPILASIEPASNDCAWYVEHAKRDQMSSYLAGDVVRVTKGKLELTYNHGTKVVLHAPAAYQLLSSMKARMQLGRLTATVPESGIGFSVLTPRATVIDLGTEFGIEVNSDSSTDVVVFKGEVDVDFNDQTDTASARRLRMGEAVRLDAIGTASRIVSINGRSYSDKALESLSRPVVISEVHDNIARTSSLWSYYEIVHQGMQEDAIAFVDRVAHQWNGIDANGIPPYLLGADYVKTFNSDKFNQDIEVSVKVEMPCSLYVLLDNRLPVPAWLERDFQDTGDDIGLDTGPFQTTQTTGTHWHNKGPSGVGPGESVEDTLSVWVKVVTEPSVVLLGSTKSPISEPNMYGIVAAPLDAHENFLGR